MGHHNDIVMQYQAGQTSLFLIGKTAYTDDLFVFRGIILKIGWASAFT